ncbi:class I SAM-dependent DNA methyltransferase [Mammaliicoccus vitulinus]|uniref:class I SAM-dependent DNA methyltransferase n=1 Tax=Mammaliicoccus vitulinus TaxID=71237 RepID=UPI00145ABD0E|nr:class I SAM-dependent methyltransferase [Mammaliicoccus vitulinus]QJF24349.1 methyltransferase domain-containing protein [Mammaliicoccus vitulinus]
MTNIYDDPEFFKGYKSKRNNPLSYNEVVEMPEMKRLMPNLENQNILDIGCGMGNLISYILIHNPKHITGVEQSQNMINESRKKFKSMPVTLHHTEFMAFNTEEKFDVIVSSLVFHYIEDFRKCCQKLSQLLNNGGVILFTMEHPIQTATMDPEVKKQDENGVYLRMENYFDESIRSANWLGKNVVKYHHTIETIFNSLIDHGLEIECVKDLGQSEEVFKYYDEDRINILRQFPPFLLVKARKKEF